MISSSYPKRGEVWWVDLPNEPVDPHQPRWAIIVSRNGRNEKSSSVVVVPTTSSSKQSKDTRVQIPIGEGGLTKPSEAMCDRVATLHKSFLRPSGPLGNPIGKDYLEQIVRGVRRAIGDLQA
jgi:mRNA-degrading endonuclease toxin of MazEF toxin-antitoxin module